MRRMLSVPSLFEEAEADNLRQAQPLAARMRPRTLAEFAGQEHFLGEGKLLRRLLTADRLGSVIFYGPPGTGKTTLARLLATESRKKFRQLSAVTSGVKDLRAILDEARDALAGGGQRTLLFIDEIHRFNKAQQDALLPDVEEGIVTLVGATTSNPFFAVNSAGEPQPGLRVSAAVGRRDQDRGAAALTDKERGLGSYDVRMHDDVLEFLAQVSEGDARRALAAPEIGVLSTNQRPIEFTRDLAAESVQRKAAAYDGTGDEHYDSISALLRASAGAIRMRDCIGWRECSKRAKTCGSCAAGSSFWRAKMWATPIRRRWCSRLLRCRLVSSSVCPNASFRWLRQ